MPVYKPYAKLSQRPRKKLGHVNHENPGRNCSHGRCKPASGTTKARAMHRANEIARNKPRLIPTPMTESRFESAAIVLTACVRFRIGALAGLHLSGSLLTGLHLARLRLSGLHLAGHH